MKHVFWKDFIREIRHSFGRFASILAIVLLGVSFFAGVSASPNNMRATADKYFDDNRMQDLRLVSTIGFNEDDVAAVRKEEHVRGVDPVYTCDMLGRVNDDENETVFSLMSVPEDLSENNEDYINRFRIYDGRLPEHPDEMVIRVSASKSQPIRVGDKISLKSGTDDDISDTLNTTEFTVVGIVWTPYSISFDLGSSSIGNGSVSYLAWIPETAFESDVYTSLFVTLDGSESYDCFTDAYFDYVSAFEDSFKDLSLKRIPERTDDIKAEIRRQVEETVTEEVTDKVTEEVEKAVREEIEKNVRSEVEKAVKQGIEDQVLSEVEKAVEEGIEKAVRTEVEKAVRTGIENTVLQAVTGEVEIRIAESVRAEVRTRAIEEIRTAVYHEVVEKVKASIEAETRNAVEQEVRAGLEETVLAEVEAQVISQIERETLASVRASVEETLRINTENSVRAAAEAELISEPAYDEMSEDDRAAYIEAYFNAAFPIAFENAKALYLESNVSAAYPAALESALALYKNSYIAIYYPEALKAAESQYLTAYVEAAMPEALKKAEALYLDAYIEAALPEAYETAEALYLESAVEGAFPEAFEAAKSMYLNTYVNDAYPAALASALSSNLQAKVDENLPAALEKAMAENFENTVRENYPEALSKAMAENFENAINEAYPEALSKAMDENFRKTVDETVPEEAAKILPDTIDEIYAEQVEENLKDTDAWKWYVLNRHAQPSYVEYQGAADQMSKIAAIFPIFFFFVAALVCFTTMTRMVDEQRSVIGTFKAIGYSKSKITLRYVLYAGVAAGIGGIIGAVLGMLIFPAVVFNAWGIAYQLPSMVQADNLLLCVISVVSMVLIVTLAAFAACFTDLHAAPAVLMRPKAPKIGKKIFLEKIPALWKHFSFSWKVTARNIFRYRRRFIMTLAGVAGCTALLVTGFGISDSIENLVTTQFDEIFRYNTVVTLKDGLSERRFRTIEELLISDEHFKNGSFFREETAVANAYKDKDGDVSDESVTLVTADNEETLAAFFLLRDPDSKTIRTLSGDGVLISDKLAKDLALKPGDTLYTENTDGIRKPVRIDAVIEMYINHYIFMSSDLYEALFGAPPVKNTYLATTALDAEGENSLGKSFMDRSEVTNVSFFSLSVKNVRQMISALSMITIVLIISSALLSFVVLYNLANVNISERLREIATIKVLGFYDPEVNIYVYRESLTITLFGALLGLPLGIFVHHIIMGTIDVQAITFGNYINPLSYVYSFLLTVGFSFIVNLFVDMKLKKIPMVESLKSVE